MTIFTELFALASSATINMIVSADTKSGKLTISILPKPRKDLGESALRKDLTLTALPQEFDEGFIEALRNYREVRTSLAKQAETTFEVLEAAKAASSKKANTTVSKASKSATSSKPAAPSSRSTEDDERDDEAGDAESTEAEAASGQGETMSLFG